MFRILIVFAVLATIAPSQNLLTNPGFESGLSGWSTFGNCFSQIAAPPQFVPHTGNGLMSCFGNWSGGFNVSGVFQQFPANPGDTFEMDVWTRHWSGDALTGTGAPTDNWVVAKMAFFDASGTEIAGAESTVLDGTFATDTWHDATPFQGTAPSGTTSVQALVLYLQPAFAGGACHVDDVSFSAVTPVPSFVPQVGMHSRVSASGALEVREVRIDGTLGPWTPYEIRGIDVGYTPAGVFPWTANPPLLEDPGFHPVLDKLKAAGVNTLRMYFLPSSGPGPRDTLDLCYLMGFKVLFALDASLIGTAQGVTDLTASVQAYGDHPAVLGFALGNEWNLNMGHGAAVARAADVQTLATTLKGLDPNRAVISSLACSPHNDLFRPQSGTTTAGAIVAVATDVDLWGMNLYRAGSFHPFFHLWPEATNDAPYAIFEWGCDTWDMNAGATDQAMQAQETAWHLDEARRVAVGQPAYSGTFLFASVDEWWKNPNANNSPAVQEPDGFFTTVTLASPTSPFITLDFLAEYDGHRSEEHFGVLELPGLAEKQVYATLADTFLNRTTPRPDLDLEILSAGWLGPQGGLDHGFWGIRVNGNDAYFAEGGDEARGLSIVEFDRSTGSISQIAHFDTYAAIEFGTTAITDAINHINALPSGALVAMAVADTATHWSGNVGFAGVVGAIQSRMGAAVGSNLGFRQGWALLGYVDAAAPIAEAVPAASALVGAAGNVVLDLDLDGLDDATDLDMDGDGKLDTWEIARGSDPVRPFGQLLTFDMTMDAGRTLTLEVLSADASGTYLDIDFASVRFELATPFQADVTSLLYSDFNIALQSDGSVTLTSIPTVPIVPGGRLVARFLDNSGRLYSASIRID